MLRLLSKLLLNVNYLTTTYKTSIQQSIRDVSTSCESSTHNDEIKSIFVSCLSKF